jgi:dolichol-phosphate mannosyltransferase
LDKLSIIIPCYNEEDGIPNLVGSLLPVQQVLSEYYQVELIFVDDGCRDKTFSLLEQAFPVGSGARVVHHPRNLGLGAAVRTGFENATGDVIVTMDSDCTYPPDQIPAMVELLKAGADIVTASPYHPKGQVVGVPSYRLFLSKTLSRVYQILLKQHIYTYTALFRAYRGRIVKSIRFKSNGFLAMAEILIFAFRAGYKVTEFPTTLHVRRYGVSKIKLWRTIKEHLGLISSLLRGEI